MVRGLAGMEREVQSLCACTHWYDEEQRLTLNACFLRGGGCRSVSGAVSCGQAREISLAECTSTNTQNMSLTQKYVSNLACGKKLTLPIHTNNGVKCCILTYMYMSHPTELKLERS